MHIKSFSESINEGIRDKMTPKPMEDVKKVIEKLSPYKALAKAKKYGLDDLIEICLERTKPINDKLYQDTKQFNKKTLREFLDFVCTWIDDQGGTSYDIQEKFNDITYSLGDVLEEGEEYEDDDGEVRLEDDVVEESIFSEDTVNLFKQFVIKYVIEHMTHSTYVREDEEEYEEEDDGDWEDDEMIVGGGAMHEDEDEDEDESEYDDIGGLEPSDEEFAEMDKQEIEKEKKKEDNKPINKIKKFLGFDKDNE